MTMDTELRRAYAVKDRLKRAVEEAIKNLPEKRQLDAMEIAIPLLEAEILTAGKPQLSVIVTHKPRTLSTEQQKRMILELAFRRFY
jgi:Flp pilus assembly protein CpaB